MTTVTAPRIATALARALAPRKPTTVSAWSDANRVLSSKGSSKPGRWATATNPPLREPEDREAIRQALLERRGRLRERVTVEARRSRLESFLEREVWSRVPAAQVGRAPDRAERERILGYGPEGV